MGALELVGDKEYRKPFASAGMPGLFFERSCLAQGVILRALGDTIAVAPPLIAEGADLEAILAVLSRALDETHAHVSHVDPA
jgi:4-aminobutyrate--pyruvate transaminase